jgi:hypothetical protein
MPTGLQVWYKFEDTVTTDSSGNGYTGTFAGGAPPTLGTGKTGQGAVFTGGGYVQVPPAAVSLASASTSCSVMAWASTTSTDRSVVGFRNSGNGNPILDLSVGYNGVNNSGGTASIIIRDNNATGGPSFGIAIVNGTAAVNDGAFHHLAGVYDGSANTLTLYVDGLAAGSTSTSLTGGLTFDAGGCNIGYDVIGYPNPGAMSGTLDDFQFYTRALSASEIAGIAGVAAGPTVWQGSGNFAGVGALSAQATPKLGNNLGAILFTGAGGLNAQTTLKLGSNLGTILFAVGSALSANATKPVVPFGATFAGTSNFTASAFLLTTAVLAGSGGLSLVDNSLYPQVIHTAHANDGVTEGLVTGINDATMLVLNGPCLVGMPVAGTGPARRITLGGSLMWNGDVLTDNVAEAVQPQIDALTATVASLQNQLNALRGFPTATFAGTSTLIASASQLWGATAAFAAVSTLAADAEIQLVGQVIASALLAGSGSLAASGSMIARGSALFAGAGGVIGNAALAFSTLDPANKSSNVTLSNGNLTASGTGPSTSSGCVRGTRGHTSGQFYCEFKVGVVGGTSAANTSAGACTNAFAITTVTSLGIDGPVPANSLGLREGAVYTAYAGTTSGATSSGGAASNDILMVAVDVTAGRAYVGVNGVWIKAASTTFNSSSFDWSFTGGTLIYPACSVEYTSLAAATTLIFNPGSSTFAYTPPSGYVAWG